MLWDLTSTDLVLIIITMQLAEQEEIRRMRREMVPRAQLMPYFDRPFIPQRYSSEPCACLIILGLCMTGQKFVGIYLYAAKCICICRPVDLTYLHYYDHARSSKRLTVPKEPCFHHIHSKKAKSCTMVSTA